MTTRQDACSCRQTDIVRYDHVTGALLCFAWSHQLTEFGRWLDDDAAVATDLATMTYIYGSDAERDYSRRHG